MQNLTGQCYCSALQYSVKNEPILKGQCHCRECQYISGGGPQLFVAQPAGGFQYTQGTPQKFTRQDIDGAVTREFCAECGTHLITRRPELPMVILKVGTLDDPSVFGGPRLAIYTRDMQPFHHIPEGMPAFDGMPDTTAEK